MKNSIHVTIRNAQLRLAMMLLISALFVACAVTYDMPVMYKKNYVPGTHALLRFDGYYYSGNERGYNPMFLYRDGSVWYGEMRYTLPRLDELLANKNPTLPHSWGNYRIDHDTILVER